MECLPHTALPLRGAAHGRPRDAARLAWAVRCKLQLAKMGRACNRRRRGRSGTGAAASDSRHRAQRRHNARLLAAVP
eukprot:scaffold1978_cov381-Prasinococcus_capsulatus_cf.AAC.4